MRELVSPRKGLRSLIIRRAMKRIYLLRHAKSSWKHPELPDHDRPLAGRGKRAAKAIVKHMRAQRFEPELVLCSTARRARETLERIEPALGRAPVRVEGDLYGASARELLACLRRLPDEVGSVLVIGHNPSCWVQGAYLYGNSGYGYRAVCNMPSDLHVSLKRNGVPIATGVSTLNVSPGPGNFINTGVQGVPLACRVNYQVVVTAYPQGGGAGMVWSTGVPRPVC